MIVVTPETKTTLVVNRYHQAFAVCTARAAIRHLISERVKGSDADGNVVSWSGTELNLAGYSSLRWYNNEVALYPDQPCLRSAPDYISGEEKQWAIPTIIVCSYHFGFHKRTGESVPLRALYKIYKGTCQYCFQKISLNSATKDHVHPKSKGGTDHDFNVVLACKSCNNKKDNIHPFFNIHGKEVKPVNINHLPFVPDNVTVREEWRPYLFTTGTAI